MPVPLVQNHPDTQKSTEFRYYSGTSRTPLLKTINPWLPVDLLASRREASDYEPAPGSRGGGKARAVPAEAPSVGLTAMRHHIGVGTSGGTAGQRSMTAMFPSSWRSPSAGARLFRRSTCSALSSMRSAAVFSLTRATRLVPGIGAMSLPCASSQARARQSSESCSGERIAPVRKPWPSGELSAQPAHRRRGPGRCCRGECEPALDGDPAIVLEVLGEVHRGHAAGAELALEAVAVGEGEAETIEGGGPGPAIT